MLAVCIGTVHLPPITEHELSGSKHPKRVAHCMLKMLLLSRGGPKLIHSYSRSRSVFPAQKEFREMEQEDRMRPAYLHAWLLCVYDKTVDGEPMVREQTFSTLPCYR